MKGTHKVPGRLSADMVRVLTEAEQALFATVIAHRCNTTPHRARAALIKLGDRGIVEKVKAENGPKYYRWSLKGKAQHV